jgi:hypothetical protein
MATIVGNKVGTTVNLLIDGNIYQKKFEQKDQADAFFQLVLKAKGGDQNDLMMLTDELNRMQRFIVNGLMESDNSGKYYLKGFNHPIPELLVNTFNEYIENSFPVTAILNFWKLLMLNPDKQIREDLFKFLSEYNFAITDNGYFVGYKVVKILKKAITDNTLLNFVNEKYNKLKSWKKSPKNFDVLYDVEGEKYLAVPTSEEHNLNDNMSFIGNLADLVENTHEEGKTVYTDKFNQTTRVVLGQPVRKDRRLEEHAAECTDNGLHIGSTNYVNSFYSEGDVVLMVLVNPAHVIHIPSSETSKMRTAEYYPYSILEKNPNANYDNRFNVLEESYFETDYANYEKERLEEDLRMAILAESTSKPTPYQLDYKKIMEERLVDLNRILNIA